MRLVGKLLVGLWFGGGTKKRIPVFGSQLCRDIFAVKQRCSRDDLFSYSTSY